MKNHTKTVFGLCVLALLVLLGAPFLGRGQDAAPSVPAQGIGQAAQGSALAEDGSYTTKDDVALYLYTYGHLPGNFITKEETRALGWPGGGLEDYAPGKCIGGDVFGNYEGSLPRDAAYHECDIDTLGASGRGAKRLVYSDAGDIYYTADHYGTFTLLYDAAGPVGGEG